MKPNGFEKVIQFPSAVSDAPLVSVCVQTYRHAPFIAACLDGILRQKTSFPFEILLGEDDSDDGTREICIEYARKYPQSIRLFLHTRENVIYVNGIATGRFNFFYNLSEARGKYIAFCDGDDYWTDPYKLQTQVGFMEENDACNLCWTRFQTLDQSTGLLSDDRNGTYFNGNSITVPFDFKTFYEGWHIGMPTLLFRNGAMLERLTHKYKYSKDIHLISELLLTGKGICLNLFTAVYRKHPDGIYSGATIKDQLKMSYLCYREIFQKNKEEIFLKRKYIKTASNYIEYFLKKNANLRALIISFQTSLDCKSPIYIVLTFLKVIHNIILSLKGWLRRIARAIVRKQSNRIAIEKFYRHFFPKEKAKKQKPPSFYKKVKSSGICDSSRNPKLIVTLTSYPARIDYAHYSIHTLLNQSLKPDKVILWLAESQFPRREKDLPRKLLELRKYGLTIAWCEDLKSYKKLIPALQAFPEDIFVTADDDIFYPEDWLEKLYVEYVKNPEVIHCHRAHFVRVQSNSILPYKDWEKSSQFQQSAHLLFCTTGAGAVYRSSFFYQDVSNIELFMDLSPTADDVWFWAMSVLNDIPVNVLENGYAHPLVIQEIQHSGLFWSLNSQGENDRQIAAVMKHYPEIMTKLMREALDT